VAAIEGLWHSTAIEASYEELLAPLQTLFGAVVMHDHVSEDPAVGRRGGMVWLGDNSIEIGSPVGPRSPVRAFVDRLGGGMHSIALRVADLAETKHRLRERGVHLVADIGEHVTFSRPSDTAGLLVEWSALRTDDDPRWGQLPDRPAEPPVAPARRYGFVTAAVEDPVAAAHQLAALFGVDVLRGDEGAPSSPVGAMVSLRDCVLVLLALPRPGTAWPWGRPPTRPRFHGHGLVVDDLGAALRALARVGVRPVAELEHAVLLDPSAVRLPTFLCEVLFPEDPRQAGERVS
jgi:catechol 2,3-dioxygenase-like lactoylglutathione lyase family enzyme